MGQDVKPRASRKPPYRERPRMFLDTETTGLDPFRHEVIEIAFVIEPSSFAPWGLDELKLHSYLARTAPMRDGCLYWVCKVAPQRIEDAELEALRINGYAKDPGSWATASPFKELAEPLLELVERCMVIGQNIDFDRQMLQWELRRCDLWPGPGFMRRHVDIMSLAYEHLVPGGLKSLSMSHVGKIVGVQVHGRAHTALVDCWTARGVYNKLERANRLQRLLWKARMRKLT